MWSAASRVFPFWGLKNSLASVNKITIPSSVLSVAGATQDKVVTVNLNDYLPEDVSLANADDANVTITP
ncbi:MAG: hypothetical protein ACLUD2_18130 [Clostridium sp.]